jgi:hypothetical protein
MERLMEAMESLEAGERLVEARKGLLRPWKSLLRT